MTTNTHTPGTNDDPGPVTDIAADAMPTVTTPIATTSQARSLATYLQDASVNGTATVVNVSGRQAVVLARRSDGRVEVHAPGSGVHALPADEPATPVTDPRTRAEVLACTVADLVRWHTTALADIRDYAIERHVTDEICQRGLAEFLDHFHLDAYQPRVTVSYTISGSYQVDSDDADDAARDASDYLKPDLSELDDVVDDSDTYTVHVTQVSEPDA